MDQGRKAEMEQRGGEKKNGQRSRVRAEERRDGELDGIKGPSEGQEFQNRGERARME